VVFDTLWNSLAFPNGCRKGVSQSNFLLTANGRFAVKKTLIQKVSISAKIELK
jgi:hypothetical protein